MVKSLHLAPRDTEENAIRSASHLRTWLNCMCLVSFWKITKCIETHILALIGHTTKKRPR